MKKFILATLFLTTLLFFSKTYAQTYFRNSVVIDTPTAYTIIKGSYQVSILGYDNGGIELKSFIGLHDNLFLGASCDIQSAIGKERAEPNVPGVIAKLKFTDGWESFPISIAIGYDSFYIGNEGETENTDNELDRMIYGPYFVVTKPIYIFDDEQHIHFGMRIPTQPDYISEDASYFLSIDVPIGDFFAIKAEGERIFYDFSRRKRWLLNLGVRYSYLNFLGIEAAILLQKHELPNRIIRIEFSDDF